MNHLPWRLTRLQLRPFHTEDLAHFYHYRSDPRVARLQGWQPYSLAQCETFIAEQRALTFPKADSWQQLAVARLDDDQLLGDVGIWLADDLSQAEFGVSITYNAQGQGYGGEVVNGVIALLFATTPVQRIIACTDKRNSACIHALSRAGMTLELSREAQYKGEICEELQFVISRKEVRLHVVTA
ncbi:GNAT family N-acetyltransferase [Shewanella dokdonensis]|uniref:GNAT family N-acetyltransferase n=1 Tax=Shewanella dokdonensis TaxID=712036 RepID=A0ABX8DGT5_9GAMM|nr:GNAT family N-acetyltransferase [Shewanella dokdonensis]MCL1074974.1 GNAT family N-acetyltransferase [Shewanella dokdonensis]QVK23406.1 GNAT family N-acetyltransferase [Shewanella dokdonensis]